MADETTPNSEGIAPGDPSRPPFPTEVVLTGSPPARAQNVAAGLPPAVATSTPAAANTVGPTPGVSPHHHETAMFFRWMAGMFIVVAFGWALIIGVVLSSRRWDLISFDMAVLVGAGLSLVLLYLLETSLWLSRFMGLRLTPHSSALTETLLLWIFGVPGLLLRSTAAEKPATSVVKSSGETDGVREIVETVVFVVVLVLMLKTFLAEAFVIPTGSMADTLLGYHKELTCQKCGYRFLVNCSSEVDPQPNQSPQFVVGGICPNCRFQNEIFVRPREGNLP